MNSSPLVKIALFGAGFLSIGCAQKQELGLTLGGIFSQQREPSLDKLNFGKINLGGGLALQANYGYRVVDGRLAALYVETHFLANGLRDIGAGNANISRDVATIFVTPGLRLKFLPRRVISPYAAVGGGYALYEQSRLTIGGAPNPAPRFTHRGAFDFGGGVDAPLWRFVGLRAEVRDFYTGNPSFNAPLSSSGQHNVVVGGGIVLRFGRREH